MKDQSGKNVNYYRTAIPLLRSDHRERDGNAGLREGYAIDNILERSLHCRTVGVGELLDGARRIIRKLAVADACVELIARRALVNEETVNGILRHMARCCAADIGKYAR